MQAKPKKPVTSCFQSGMICPEKQTYGFFQARFVRAPGLFEPPTWSPREEAGFTALQPPPPFISLFLLRQEPAPLHPKTRNPKSLRAKLPWPAEPMRAALLDWFAGAKRPLPWREGYDPYQVWVSEIMLQQTQVEAMLPYYRRWMKRFPTIASVARARQQTILKMWEGLGYYSRARALHQAAREILRLHGGELPREEAALRALPGIGPYTTGAILSIAFNEAVPTVDGNIGRVLSRIHALPEPPATPAGRRAMWTLAGQLVPPSGARDFNQGLMELGALVCRPRSPDCPNCPLNPGCLARAQGAPEAYPRRAPSRPRREVEALMLLVESGGRLLLRQRPPSGLWGGLWEFPWLEREAGQSNQKCLGNLLAGLALPGRQAAPPRALGQVRHDLTHLRFRWECLHISLPRLAGRGTAPPLPDHGEILRWVARENLVRLPLGKPAHRALALLPEKNCTPRP